MRSPIKAYDETPEGDVADAVVAEWINQIQPAPVSLQEALKQYRILDVQIQHCDDPGPLYDKANRLFDMLKSVAIKQVIIVGKQLRHAERRDRQRLRQDQRRRAGHPTIGPLQRAWDKAIDEWKAGVRV